MEEAVIGGTYMRGISFWISFMVITLTFAACKSEKTQEIGQVRSCENGSYFNLQTGSCQLLAGHLPLKDALGFERVVLSNGITVPRVINGKTPFSVRFSYNVSRRTSFDVVLKKVEFGSMGGDNYSDWAKVTVEAGEGIAIARLFPKDGKPIPEAKAANNVEGQWLGDDAGYAIEIKGGDRFEDDDADEYKVWRVGGIAIDAAAPDDPEAKIYLLGDMKLADTVSSCGEVQGSIEVVKTELDLIFKIGLKEPGSNWYSWGEMQLEIAQGSRGIYSFHFLARDKDGRCPPPGEKVQIEPWQAKAGQYLIQLDIFDEKGQQLKVDHYLYEAARSSVGMRVLAPELSESLEESSPNELDLSSPRRMESF